MSRAVDTAVTDHPASPSLTSRVVKGGAWVLGGKLASRGLQVLRLVVLARLLSPEDFGLFGIVTLALTATEALTQTGFHTALIQRKAETEGYLDTAWTIQVLRGFVLAGVLYGAAPFLAMLFGELRAVPLLRALCAIEVLGGFTNVGTIYFQKELEFHKQAAHQLLSSAVALAVGVFLAWQVRNVWALVWAQVAGQLASLVLSYRLHPYRPRLRLNRAQAAELFAFGRWVLGSAVVVFLSTKVDQAVVGRVLGAGALGVYAIAHQIADVPATEVAHLASSVMMPTYAKLQEDQRRLGSAFLKTFELIMFLSIPLTVFIVLASAQIVLGFLGPQWQEAIGPLRILAVAGLLRAVYATGGPLFVGAGVPRMDFWMNLGRGVIIAAASYPLTRRFGIPGTSAAVVLALVAILPVWAKLRHVADIPAMAIARASVPGLLLAAPVAVVVIGIGRLAPDLSPFSALALQAIASALVCGITALLSMRWVNRGLPGLARQAWKSRIGRGLW